jgi:hypothetical protein
MIFVTGLAILALFALLAILVEPAEGSDEQRHQFDPRNDLPIWALLGRR